MELQFIQSKIYEIRGQKVMLDRYRNETFKRSGEEKSQALSCRLYV